MLGLIPAWAGKTLIKRVSNEPPRAHPRVGGENLSTTVIPGVANGSSPRGRGKPVYDGDPWRGERLIPAWAGKTSSNRTGSVRCGAHPRVGGENG